VDLEEIEQNDFNLNIPRYVDTTEPEEAIDVSEELVTLKALMTERDHAERTMLEYLEELGYGA
jgi:type I restriction enzyme M protein